LYLKMETWWGMMGPNLIKACFHWETRMFLGNLGPLHTQDWEPVTITLQALSLVE
jgi:hypothetical protein